MRLLKESTRRQPRVSLILLDWSVRESFHLLYYLARQDVPRDDFEVIVIEYYSRVSDAIRKFEDQVDTWMLLEMPEDCYYHKHLMYNAGIVLARGDICVVCDSDAMVKPGFIRAILEQFEKDPQLVLHIDQFRNNRRDFYPFNYPSFEEVEGAGCINNVGGKTAGILDKQDPIHSRNYGACMCARRSDLIAIGGADEHVDFVGHICGPYDMTFRLVNNRKRELWHPTEFMYHTWHPGQAGVDNYLGPHDGRHVSTTSLAALSALRTRPLLENPAIRMLREHPDTPAEALIPLLIRPEGLSQWRRDILESGAIAPQCDPHDLHIGYYKGYTIYCRGDVLRAYLAIDEHRELGGRCKRPLRYIEARSMAAIRERIDADTPRVVETAIAIARIFVFAWQFAYYAVRRAKLHRPLLAGRSAGAKGWVSEIYSRLHFRLTQFAVQRKAIVDSLANLVPNLRYIGRLSRNRGEPAAATDIVVETLLTATYLKLLRALGVIPGMRIERAESPEHVERAVTESAGPGGHGRLILTRNVYYSYYPFVAQFRLRGGVTVL
jgi:hypothetical protein